MKTILLAIVVAAAAITACTTPNSSDNASNAQHPEHMESTKHEHGSHAATAADSNNNMQRIMDDMMAQMHAAKPSGNPDHDFTAMMIAHHKGAIDMARAELSSGTDAQIRKLAEGIIAAQEKEIAEMQNIQASLPEGDVKANAAAYDALMNSMSGMMAHTAPASGSNRDKDFVQAMIPHHEGAVAMAKVELQHGYDEKLKAMAQKMVDDQTREIAEMRAWLAANQ